MGFLIKSDREIQSVVCTTCSFPLIVCCLPVRSLPIYSVRLILQPSKFSKMIFCLHKLVRHFVHRQYNWARPVWTKVIQAGQAVTKKCGSCAGFSSPFLFCNSLAGLLVLHYTADWSSTVAFWRSTVHCRHLFHSTFSFLSSWDPVFTAPFRFHFLVSVFLRSTVHCTISILLSRSCLLEIEYSLRLSGPLISLW